MQIIAISGHAQHGKDTVAELLAAALRSRDHRVVIIHYADVLKYIYQTYFNWDGKKDVRGRHLLQSGAEHIQRKNPSFLIDFMVSFLNLFGEDNWDDILIPDARLPQEINVLKEFGYSVQHIKVVRPNAQDSLTEDQKLHFTETALDNVVPDYTIINDGSLEHLKFAVLSYSQSHL